MRSLEWVNVWHDTELNGLELHHATYITHTFARHAPVIHDGKGTRLHRLPLSWDSVIKVI
jgi:hypothetical protein